MNTGTKWIKMVGTACSLSVGPADQVFIVCPAMDDRNVFLINFYFKPNNTNDGF